MNDFLLPKLRRYSQILFANHGLTAGRTYVANKPFYLFLEITNRCNIECIHCGRTHDPRYQEKGHTGDLPLHLIQKLKPIIPFATYVVPTGVGEPFLNRDLLPAVRFLKDCGANVSVTSNGTILNDRLSQAVLESGLDKIVFSLDGARPETFNSIRAGADFDRVVRNIGNLRRLRDASDLRHPLIEIEMIAMAENFHDLLLLPEVAAGLGAERLIVETLFEHSGEVYARILDKQKLTNIPLQEGRRVWASFLEKTREHGLQLTSSLQQRDLRSVFGTANGHAANSETGRIGTPDYQAAVEPLAQTDEPKSQFKKAYCTQPWSIAYVTWKGEVRTCCFNETVLGNLNDSNFEDIWNSPAYRRFRRTILAGGVPKGCHDCLQAGFNYDIVPKVNADFLIKKAGQFRDQLITAIR